MFRAVSEFLWGIVLALPLGALIANADYLAGLLQ